MFLRGRNICSAWKNTVKTYRQFDTCCRPVIKLRSKHVFTTSRLAISSCGCRHDSKATNCSTPTVRSTRYLWPYSTRSISTSSIRVGVAAPSISSRLAADRLIRDMSEGERDHLEKALNDMKEELQLETDHVDERPTRRQLWLTAVNNSLPFIGFGFLDNAIMIMAGEYIDMTLGAAFGISTMAAAGLGNCISDVAGIGLAGYVEVLASRLGIEEPKLTAQQLMMKSTRFANYGGRGAGIMLGCFLGMFPLLFMNSKSATEEEEEEKLKNEYNRL